MQNAFNLDVKMMSFCVLLSFTCEFEEGIISTIMA